MLIEAYIEALLVDEELADLVGEALGFRRDRFTTSTYCLVTNST